METQDRDDGAITFESLGFKGLLLDAISTLRWEEATPVQAVVLPHIQNGRDLVVTSEPGSGKTGAFALPILKVLQRQDLMHYALVLEPTRELAIQVAEQFQALGRSMGIKVVTLVGREDMERQAKKLMKKRPHVIVATPGRILDHLMNTKHFNLEYLQVLVIDEADQLLKVGKKLSKLLGMLPEKRQTLLFSATMPKEMQKLNNLNLKDPVEIRANQLLPHRLEQFYLKCWTKERECYLAAVLQLLFLQRVLVFCNTWVETVRVYEVLKCLGYTPLMLHGKMPQAERNKSLSQFKKSCHSPLVATDVASRGVDFPDVAAVINFDLPKEPEDYPHRVGRTARVGKRGTAISFVNEVNVKYYLHLEHVWLNGRKLPEFDLQATKENILRAWEEKVKEAKSQANMAVDWAVEQDTEKQNKWKSNKRPLQELLPQQPRKKQKM